MRIISHLNYRFDGKSRLRGSGGEGDNKYSRNFTSINAPYQKNLQWVRNSGAPRGNAFQVSKEKYTVGYPKIGTNNFCERCPDFWVTLCLKSGQYP
jgi:hypothetical protein